MYELPKRTHLFRFRNGIAVSQLILPGHEDGFDDDREALREFEKVVKRGVIVEDIVSISPADVYSNEIVTS